MKRENANTAQTLGYALIGRGGAGRAHAGWAADTEGVAVRGFCDIHEGAAQQLQAQHSAEYATTDPERVFSDPGVDNVSIAASHSSLAELAVAACQAGKHLFLDKPMALTTAVLYEHFRKATFTAPDPGEGQKDETLTPPPIERLSLLVDAIRNDSAPYVPPQAGILSALLVETITASIHSSQPQKVDLSVLPTPIQK